MDIKITENKLRRLMRRSNNMGANKEFGFGFWMDDEIKKLIKKSNKEVVSSGSSK